MKLTIVCIREAYSGLNLEIDESVTYYRQTGMDVEID
jgi:hypothetical protein